MMSDEELFMQWFISNGGVCDKVEWPCVIDSGAATTDIPLSGGSQAASEGGGMRGVRAVQDVKVDQYISTYSRECSRA